MPDKKILIVEDEENLRETISYRFSAEGYAVATAADGQQALDMVQSFKPDLVLLDVMLPGIDGFEVCRIVRKTSTVPILMLTAKDEEIDKVVGLEVGADDYVTKPFSTRELVARVKALLRRAETASTEPARNDAMQVAISGDLRLDPGEHRAWLGGRLLDLTPREFDLLAFFMRHKGQAVTREQLLDTVWGYGGTAIDTRTVDVHVRWLREKIEADPSDARRITTVRRIGYRFEG